MRKVALCLFLSALFITSATAGPMFSGYGAGVNTYFFAASGSDSNTGLSPASPWQTITKFNATSFPAGSYVFFNGGDTFTGTLNAPTNGTSTNPVTIQSYDTGVAIISSGTGNCITAQTIDGWAVNGLKCQGNGTTNAVDGVYIDNANNSGTLSQGITLNNIEIVGYGRNGVQISGQNGGGFAHITIENCQIHGNTFGATTVNANAGVFVVGVFPTSAPHSDINVKSCQIHDNPGLTATDTIGNGIFFGGVTSGLIDHNAVYSNGASAVSGSGPSGILLGYSHNVTIQFNEVNNNTSGNAVDGDGIDLDIGCASNTVQYNWVHDNLGVGLFGFQNSAVGAPAWSGNIYRYNITQNNGTLKSQGFNGEMFLFAGATMSGVQIYGNTFFESDFGHDSPAVQTSGGSSTSVVIANNILALNMVNTTAFLAVTDNGGTINITGNAYIINTDTNFVYNGTNYTSLAAFRAGTGQEGGGGTPTGTTTNVNFFGSGNSPGPTTNGYNPSLMGAFKFAITSSAVDGGVNLSSVYGITVPQDYYGDAVPDTGGGYTIGAYSYPK